MEKKDWRWAFNNKTPEQIANHLLANLVGYPRNSKHRRGDGEMLAVAVEALLEGPIPRPTGEPAPYRIFLDNRYWGTRHAYSPEQAIEEERAGWPANEQVGLRGRITAELLDKEKPVEAREKRHA